MKKIYVLLLLVAYNLQGQQANLFGVKWSGSAFAARQLNVSNNMATNVGALTGTTVLMGESAIDRINNRYFCSSGSGIEIIDAVTGTVQAVLTPTIQLMGIEYNTNTGEIVGTYMAGGTRYFGSVNLTNGIVSTISALGAGLSVAQGISTFDQAGNRYIFKTPDDVMVVDAATGTVLATISNSKIANFEWDPVASRLVGVYWNGSVEKFVSVDLNTGISTDLSTLNTVTSKYAGESAFDPLNQQYFLGSVDGLLVLDATNGNIIMQFPTVECFLMEFMGALNEGPLDGSTISPATVLTKAGEEVTLSATLSHSLACMQWQVQQSGGEWVKPVGERYSGVEAPNLTISNITLDDHQSNYRLVGRLGSATYTSDVVALEVGPTGLAGINRSDFRVYPNPSSGEFQIQTSVNGFVVELFDARGAKLMKQYSNSTTLSISTLGLTHGLYHVLISDEHGNNLGQKKVVVQ